MDMTNRAGCKKKSSSFSLWDWLLWWRIDEGGLLKEVKEYKTLKITQSSRGMSVILMFISAIISIPTFLFFGLWQLSLFNIVVSSVIGFFTYKGRRWAIFSAMLLLGLNTLDRVFSSFQLSQNTSSSIKILGTIFWWAIYMHFLYLAWQVENLRLKTAKVLNVKVQDRVVGAIDNGLDGSEKPVIHTARVVNGEVSEKIDETWLEKKIIYRLIKVAYFLSLIGLVIFVVGAGWSLKPERYLDYLSARKSGYTAEEINKYLKSTTGTGFDFLGAEREGYSDKEISSYLTSKLVPIYSKGGWEYVVLIWVGGVLASYLVLNIIRETLLYVIFGKTFSWKWLFKNRPS